MLVISFVFFFQAEDGIRDLVRSRGLGDVYKRQLSLVTVTMYETGLEILMVIDGLVCPELQE